MKETSMHTKYQTTDPALPANTEHTRQDQPTWQRIMPLAIGDIIVFLVFALVGIRSHSEGIDVPKVLITAAPFAVAWFLVSPFIGAFRRDLEARPVKMVQYTLLAWLATWPVALLFRGLLEWKVPPLSFALVTLISNALFLLIWRWPFAIVKRKRQS